jgi:hypothetical protein
MPHPTRRDIGRLIDAINEVETVMDHLNTSSKTCECCGVIAYSNWEENRLHQSLGGVVTKLERAKGSLIAIMEGRDGQPAGG